MIADHSSPQLHLAVHHVAAQCEECGPQKAACVVPHCGAHLALLAHEPQPLVCHNASHAMLVSEQSILLPERAAC